MNEAMHNFLSIDLLPMLAGTLAAVTCGLLGNFLVLRRLSLMGDAISHSVLPGLVMAFLITGMRSPIAMFGGAAIAGVVTVVLVELVKKLGRVEPGAAMGVVFSVLFALGVLLIERAAARQVDLDADCVLHGQLETLFWFPPGDWGQLFSFTTLSEVPRQVVTLIVMTIAAVVFVALLFKELRIAAFDPALATTLGYNAGMLHYLLMIFVAAATVASFEAVGSILVIAMLVCPAATARLLTDRLRSQIVCSVVVAGVSGIGGYVAATALPAAFGLEAVNAAGMMTVVAALLLVIAIVFAPQRGIIARRLHQRRLGRTVALDDMLAALYRLEEAGTESVDKAQLATLQRGHKADHALDQARKQLLVASVSGAIQLTEAGRAAARQIIRRHRQWERYLVDQAGFAADHVHEPAEQLEHINSAAVQRNLAAATKQASVDPHGRPVPNNNGDDDPESATH